MSDRPHLSALPPFFVDSVSTRVVDGQISGERLNAKSRAINPAFALSVAQLPASSPTPRQSEPAAPSGRRDNFAAFGVEETPDRFTRVFIILNDSDQDAGLLFLQRSSDSSTPREQT
jgi:hypothetical protein